MKRKTLISLNIIRGHILQNLVKHRYQMGISSSLLLMVVRENRVILEINFLHDLEQNLVLLQLGKTYTPISPDQHICCGGNSIQTVLHIFTEYPLTSWILIMKLNFPLVQYHSVTTLLWVMVILFTCLNCLSFCYVCLYCGHYPYVLFSHIGYVIIWDQSI